MRVEATTAAPAHAFKGRPAWIITDGKAGMEVQVKGVARALGANYEAKRVSPHGVWRLLAPWNGIDPREKFGQPGSQFAPPWPAIALATGRLSIPAIRAVRKASPETYTVVIQNPRTGTGTADLIAVPAHDRLTGANVIHTLTAPHGFSPQRLSQLRALKPKDLAALPGPKVVIVLGGPNKVYRFTETDSVRLAASLASIASLGASFLITVSRRTPGHALQQMRTALAGAPAIFWEGEGDNPYPLWLAHGDIFVVTADSINMTGEACVTGRPVYVFEPKGGSAKFAHFHENLRRYGATKPLPERLENLESWTYAPLDSAAQIAAEIERRCRNR
jgi:mitochondrial fission protein ELM1